MGDKIKERQRELNATLFHDLQAPLRAISGFTEALIEDHGAEFSPEARAYLDFIADNAARMAKLVEDRLRGG